MAFGTGKYGELAAVALHCVDAQAVVVYVIGGDWGDGFAGCLKPDDPLVCAALARSLAAKLRSAADVIETDAAAMDAAVAAIE